ncbi:MAG: helix-turn-helix domain-containing protein [Chloroflexota bacterium]|nr:helix-turn-helix domain-containing protein [Chloroflexota bacterium]
MGAENFNRQFILLDFADLDNPDFLSFTRSPEFSTYLVMRRHVWRSRDPHYMGLHTLYAGGFLACSLEREQIAELLGLSLVTISNDIQALAARKVIESRRTGRQNIFMLGRWVEDEGAYFEHFYLDRLYVRSKENLISELHDSRSKRSFTSDNNPSSPSEVKRTLLINRESNRERNTEENREGNHSNVRLAPPPKKQGRTRERKVTPIAETTTNESLAESLQQQGGGRARDAAELAAERLDLAGFIEDFRRELNDQAPAGASLTRAVNLYRRSGLTPEAFRTLMYDARRLTQQHSASIRTQPPAKGATSRLSGKPKMAYFFSVLENSLGLREPHAPGAADGAPAVPEPRPAAAEGETGDTGPPGSSLDRSFVEDLANTLMSRRVNWRLARDLARENPHLVADWLEHGGIWTLAHDPGEALAELIRAGKRPPRTRASGD